LRETPEPVWVSANVESVEMIDQVDDFVVLLLRGVEVAGVIGDRSLLEHFLDELDEIGPLDEKSETGDEEYADGQDERRSDRQPAPIAADPVARTSGPGHSRVREGTIVGEGLKIGRQRRRRLIPKLRVGLEAVTDDRVERTWGVQPK